MKTYQIGAVSVINGQTINGRIKCNDIENVMLILANYGFIVNRLVTII